MQLLILSTRILGQIHVQRPFLNHSRVLLLLVTVWLYQMYQIKDWKGVDILKARYAEKEACNILQMLTYRYGQTWFNKRLFLLSRSTAVGYLVASRKELEVLLEHVCRSSLRQAHGGSASHCWGCRYGGQVPVAQVLEGQSGRGVVPSVPVAPTKGVRIPAQRPRKSESLNRKTLSPPKWELDQDKWVAGNEFWEGKQGSADIMVMIIQTGGRHNSSSHN